MQQIQFSGGNLVLMRDGEQDKDAIAMAVKMQALAKAVGTVKKDGRNTHFNYAFVSYEALAATVREALQDVGLAFFVSTTGDVLDGDMTTLHGSLSFMDSATGAILSVPWVGQGKDGQDKGASKALTSGLKYALMRLLLASERDEVDSDKDGPSPTQQHSSQQPQQRSTTASAGPTSLTKLSPEGAKSRIQMTMQQKLKDARYPWTNKPCPDNHIGAFRSEMKKILSDYPEDQQAELARRIMRFFVGKESSAELTEAEARGMSTFWRQTDKDENGKNVYSIIPSALATIKDFLARPVDAVPQGDAEQEELF